VSLNIPFDVIGKAARGEMRTDDRYRQKGDDLLRAGRVRNLLMAGGSASRWKCSLETLIKAGLVDEAEVPESLPRALAAYWLGSYTDPDDSYTGVGLAIDNAVSQEQNGYLAPFGYVLSPYTWVDFMKETWKRIDRADEPIEVAAISQNSGEALVVQDGKMTGERLPGKVLGHGNVRGWILGVIEGLKKGVVFDIAHSADNPFSQPPMTQFREIVGRMSEDVLVHVALGNWRNIGQFGGGFVNVNGTPNVIDTAIAKEENKDGFSANRDINIFSLFINVVNNAALLYAVSDGMVVLDEAYREQPLISWEEVQALTRGDDAAVWQRVSSRLERLTEAAQAQLMDNFISLLPSEYVTKSEGGKDFVQWEQISGMLHGAMVRAIQARHAKEGVEWRRPLNMAYVDISLNDMGILYGRTPDQAAIGEYTPTFAEVKSASDLYTVLDRVRFLLGVMKSRKMFSDAVKLGSTAADLAAQTAAEAGKLVKTVAADAAPQPLVDILSLLAPREVEDSARWFERQEQTAGNIVMEQIMADSEAVIKEFWRMVQPGKMISAEDLDAFFVFLAKRLRENAPALQKAMGDVRIKGLSGAPQFDFANIRIERSPADRFSYKLILPIIKTPDITDLPDAEFLEINVVDVLEIGQEEATRKEASLEIIHRFQSPLSKNSFVAITISLVTRTDLTFRGVAIRGWPLRVINWLTSTRLYIWLSYRLMARASRKTQATSPTEGAKPPAGAGPIGNLHVGTVRELVQFFASRVPFAKVAKTVAAELEISQKTAKELLQALAGGVSDGIVREFRGAMPRLLSIYLDAAWKKAAAKGDQKLGAEISGLVKKGVATPGFEGLGLKGKPVQVVVMDGEFGTGVDLYALARFQIQEGKPAQFQIHRKLVDYIQKMDGKKRAEFLQTLVVRELTLQLLLSQGSTYDKASQEILQSQEQFDLLKEVNLNVVFPAQGLTLELMRRYAGQRVSVAYDALPERGGRGTVVFRMPSSPEEAVGYSKDSARPFVKVFVEEHDWDKEKGGPAEPSQDLTLRLDRFDMQTVKGLDQEVAAKVEAPAEAPTAKVEKPASPVAPAEIVFASNGDDWEGLYVDGQLVSEGHSLRPGEVLEALKLDFAELDDDGIMAYLEDAGNFPENLGELTKKKITNKIVLVHGDDWNGFYIDGKLAMEGHSYDSRHVLDALKIKSTRLPEKVVNKGLDRFGGRLPEKLSDMVKKEEKKPAKVASAPKTKTSESVELSPEQKDFENYLNFLRFVVSELSAMPLDEMKVGVLYDHPVNGPELKKALGKIVTALGKFEKAGRISEEDDEKLRQAVRSSFKLPRSMEYYDVDGDIMLEEGDSRAAILVKLLTEYALVRNHPSEIAEIYKVDISKARPVPSVAKTATVPTIKSAEGGVVVEVHTDGHVYVVGDASGKRVQFPRDLRIPGARFRVAGVVDAGSFYRLAKGGKPQQISGLTAGAWHEGDMAELLTEIASANAPQLIAALQSAAEMTLTLTSAGLNQWASRLMDLAEELQFGISREEFLADVADLPDGVRMAVLHALAVDQTVRQDWTDDQRKNLETVLRAAGAEVSLVEATPQVLLYDVTREGRTQRVRVYLSKTPSLLQREGLHALATIRGPTAADVVAEISFQAALFEMEAARPLEIVARHELDELFDI
ncbi:MAG TPA: hypothetical protein P5079_09540, partial [Elusimicrobiota bacterium]|nr:hypothetical protein [Elusimicrobiota bacterium]